MLRDAVRRRSWNSRCGTFASLQAVAQALRKSYPRRRILCGKEKRWRCFGNVYPEKNDFVKHNPGKSERELAELWIPYLVKETIKYAPSKAGVGGDIDAIKIDETGIHWFARKANCPATE